VAYGHRAAGVELDFYVAINIAVRLSTNMPSVYSGPAYLFGARPYKSRFFYVYLYRLILMSLLKTVIVYGVLVVFF
jgi:hypothetical protein